MGGKRGPIRKVIVTGDREPGIVEREASVKDIGIRNALRKPLYLFVEKVGMLAVEQINGCGIGGATAWS